MDISTVASAAAQGPAQRGFSQLTENFDTFLTLLTTQLRNQDPLEPLDTEKFTEQLVQFASVEQSIQTNQHLEALLALQNSSANETALAMVGRVASVNSDTAGFNNGSAQWTYTLPAEAAAVSVQVLDAWGAVVAELEGEKAAGIHNMVWSGQTKNGAQATSGTFRLSVIATDNAGDPISANISSTGYVDAVAFQDGAPAIEIAGQSYAIDLVSRIDQAK